MFEDLYDSITRLCSWRWPIAQGEVTLVEIERVNPGERNESVRLSVVYKFSLGSDGPYCGESFWAPAFTSAKRMRDAEKKLFVGHPVSVRYRPDDPSINRLDRSAWQGL